MAISLEDAMLEFQRLIPPGHVMGQAAPYQIVLNKINGPEARIQGAAKYEKVHNGLMAGDVMLIIQNSHSPRHAAEQFMRKIIGVDDPKALMTPEVATIVQEEVQKALAAYQRGIEEMMKRQVTGQPAPVMQAPSPEGATAVPSVPKLEIPPEIQQILSVLPAEPPPHPLDNSLIPAGIQKPVRGRQGRPPGSGIKKEPKITKSPEQQAKEKQELLEMADALGEAHRLDEKGRPVGWWVHRIRSLWRKRVAAEAAEAAEPIES